MAAPKPFKRITIDYRFAAVPAELVTDSRVSAQAMRLWCVLFILDYLHVDPTIENIGEHMQQDTTPASRRSIYRWLGELEQTGWLDWQRAPGKAGVNDRFVLVTRPAQPVPYLAQVADPDMNPVPNMAQPVPYLAQPVPNMRQVDPFSPPLEQQKPAPQNHENHENHEGGGDARDLLKSLGLYRGTIKQIMAMNIDPQTLHASVTTLLAAGWTVGAIADQLREHPPKKGEPYVIAPEQQRPAQANHSRRSASRAKASHAPSGGADLRDPGWAARAIAEAEARAAELS